MFRACVWFFIRLMTFFLVICYCHLASRTVRRVPIIIWNPQSSNSNDIKSALVWINIFLHNVSNDLFMTKQCKHRSVNLHICFRIIHWTNVTFYCSHLTTSKTEKQKCNSNQFRSRYSKKVPKLSGKFWFSFKRAHKSMHNKTMHP